MGTKLKPGAFDCFRNALPDEPMFILLARDPWAPKLVEDWAMYRENMVAAGNRPPTDKAMVTEARTCAHAMGIWRTMNDGRWRTAKPLADPYQALLAARRELWVDYCVGRASTDVDPSGFNDRPIVRILNDAIGAPFDRAEMKT